ncbi:MAG: hypothetical protein PHW60_13545 [Kiritimatiellae bacterium]|nr:hypothetical protein [Kiritimatiellia bacterium]
MDLLYAKYNRHRLPPFQIETSIWRDRDRKFVLKKALVSDAVPHLQRLCEQAAPIRHSLHGDRVRLPEVTVVDKQTLRLDFVEGRSLDALLVSAFREQDQARFMGIIADYLALLKNAFATASAPVFTESMRQIFGLTSPAELDGLGPFLTPAMVDLVFENILVDGERYYLVDHEWVFEGCLPVSFILFRSLFYFYEKNKAFDLESWMPLHAVLERFALSPETVRRYREMDEAFQAHVFGRERCYRYKDRYVKYAHSVPSLLETIEHQRQVVHEYNAEIIHLRQVIDVMQNSRVWKFVQKTGGFMDKHFPPGTRRRRVLESLRRRLQALD